ncbi:hypothetical protein [Dokdonia sp.]|uniref:hypothetical protein n=1 Tax=Dokdonia sp. TaxID=2024995 RepID=UPI0032676271
MKFFIVYIALILFSIDSYGQYTDGTVDSIRETSYAILKKKMRFKEKTIWSHSYSSISEVKKSRKFIQAITTLKEGNRIDIKYYKLKRNKYMVHISDPDEPKGVTNYEFAIHNKEILYESRVDIMETCRGYSEEDFNEQWIKQYHYTTDELQQFSLVLLHKINTTIK